MAMSIGGENRPDYVRPRHLEALLGEAGLAVAAGRRRVRGLAENAAEAATATARALADDGWAPPIADALLDLVAERARWLSAAAA
jgi:hypothetical protein